MNDDDHVKKVDSTQAHFSWHHFEGLYSTGSVILLSTYVSLLHVKAAEKEGGERRGFEGEVSWLFAKVYVLPTWELIWSQKVTQPIVEKSWDLVMWDLLLLLVKQNT